MNANNIIALPVAAPPGKWLGAGGANIIDGEKQYIGVVSMADVAMHLVKERARPGALKEGVVSLIGNSAEGLSLWVASNTTPLVDAMEPLSKGIHRLLVRCPIAPAPAADSTLAPSSAAPSSAAPSVMTFGHTTPDAPDTPETPLEAASEIEASASRPATGAESDTEAAAAALPVKHSYHFVSQTDVVAFLLMHLDSLGTWFSAPWSS
ncbi:hypothetical protein CLOM_g6981 [Closterium sp. NIES-68]|nr:hypothetical protein CLOM_g6981 [Closterium sp. NIES-68]